MDKKEAEQKAIEMAGLSNPEEIFKPQGQVKFYLEEQPIYYDENCVWWMWCRDDKKWKLTDETDILNRIEDLTNEDIITPKNRTMIINSLKQECRKSKPIDIEPTWIQFKDEIIDIKTGDRFKANPSYFVTNPIPYKLNIDGFELTPTMDKIFSEWVGEDNVKTLYEIIAYCLLPSYPLNRLFCFMGSGMNGKSCFLNLIRKFIGTENACSTELDTLMASRFEVTRLHKKLICLMGETNFSTLSKTSMLKKLTGGDLIGFEYKGSKHFEDINYAKIIISTNNLPDSDDKTMGFYRRWLIIDFPNEFSEQKDILSDIPEEEYECLALKCTGILHDLLIKRQFHNEGSVYDRMKKYEEKSDFTKKFVDDFTEEDIDGFITKSDFNKKFTSWCKENKHRELSPNSIANKMKNLGIDGGKKNLDWLYDGKGGQARVWLGIKWKE